MFRFKIALLTLVITGVQWIAYTPDADAGLLRDWLRRARRPFAQTAQPLVANTTGSIAGLQPGQCARTCQQTCSRVVVNYVPCTSYRTSYERVPVTQFRPQTTSDPCTGCTVTCMRPCTTYTYRTKRVPYTTYRPVYRTETYRVPVTTITNDCNTCSTCSTCPTAGVATGGQVIGGSQTTNSIPQQQFNGTLSTNGGFGVQEGSGTSTTLPGTTITPLPTPADSVPSIINPQNSNRSVIDSLGGSATRIPFPQQQPQRQQQSPSSWTLTSSDKPANNSTVNNDWYTATSVASSSPVTKKWSYTPVKQSTYVTLDAADEEEDDDSEVTTFRGSFSPVVSVKKPTAKVQKKTERLVNQGWETVDW